MPFFLSYQFFISFINLKFYCFVKGSTPACPSIDKSQLLALLNVNVKETLCEPIFPDKVTAYCVTSLSLSASQLVITREGLPLEVVTVILPVSVTVKVEVESTALVQVPTIEETLNVVGAGSVPLSLQETKATTKTDRTIRNSFLEFFIEFLLLDKLFITKQGFFIFLDKLSKVIEVKKVLTKLILNFCNKNSALKKLNALKSCNI